MDAVRAPDADRVAVLLGARQDRVEEPVDPCEDEAAGLLELQRQSRVDDVGRGQPEMEPTPFRPELLGDRVDEGGRVMVGEPLELGDASGARRLCVGTDRLHVLRGHDADLRPTVQRSEFHVKPMSELALVRPDPGHGRAGVTRDHSLDSRAGSGRRSHDSGCEHRRILRVVDADAGYGHARRHLHDREERVEPVQDAQ